MTVLNLHGTVISPYMARVMIAMRFKKLDFEVIQESRATMALPEFKAMNPMSKMPALDDEGTFVAESMVICEYLDDKYPANPLVSSDPALAAKARTIATFADMYIQAPIQSIIPHMSRKVRVQAVVDKGLADIERGLDAIEAMLRGEGYAVGDEPGLADCFLIPTLIFLYRILGIFKIKEPIGGRPNIRAYLDVVNENEEALRLKGEIVDAMDAFAEQLKKK